MKPAPLTLPQAFLRACQMALALALLAACGRRPTAAPAATSTPGSAPDPTSAAVNEVVNIVEARAAAVEAFAPVSVGYMLETGGQVKTGLASRARLDFSDGAILRLAQNSTFTLRAVTPEADGLFTRLILEAGRIWVSLTGGVLEVTTPVGVAAVRGSFAVFQFDPGDPDNPDDDLLLLDCLEGSCTAQNEAVDEQLGNLERVVLNNLGSLRLPLTDADVQAFLQENPESQGLAATLTAAPPATETPTPAPTQTESPSPTAPPDATLTPVPSATPSSTPPPTFTPQPGATILGQHTVLAGETLYCIGRGYGVIPEAIAQVNGLATPFFVQPGQALRIPAVRWVNITLGPVCPPQFTSPFPALPTATLTPRPSATSTNTSAPPPPPAATSTNTPVALTPTSTPVVPTPTFSPTPTATLDTFGPTITNLNVNPTSVGAGSPVFSCLVTFNVDISDPAGILVSPGPMVLWTASDLSGMAFANSTIPMTLLTGITWTASLSVDMTFAPSSPYYGTVNWSVQASDNLNNSTTQPSLTTIDVPLAQGGCP